MGLTFVAGACGLFLKGFNFCALIVLAASIPFWLPPVLIGIRFKILTAINGEEGIELPCEKLGVTGATFKTVYNSEAVDLRSRQSNYGLSDFFWYLLAPAHAIHQEHLETKDVRYKICSAVTRKICNVSEDRLRAIAIKYSNDLLSPERLGKGSWEAKRHLGSWEQGFLVGSLRDLFFPCFQRMVFELVFEIDLADVENKAMTLSAENVLKAIKGVDTRNVKLRREMCDLLLARVEATDGTLGELLHADITAEEWALFLQGVFFTTAVVQLSEAMAHIHLALAQHQHVLTKLQSELEENYDEASKPGSYLNNIITEALRVWPLFGIAHRITSDDVKVSDSVTFPKGSVLCFNYPKYHMTGYEQPESFIPDRWSTLKEREQNYLPFGAPSNRPCPGKRLSLIWMREMTKITAQKLIVHSPTEHTRSLPCGGLALMLVNQTADKKVPQKLLGMLLRVLVFLSPVPRSIKQIINELCMLRESRKLQLAQAYFNHYLPLDFSQGHKPCLSNQLYR
eukprot:gene3811-4764_t